MIIRYISAGDRLNYGDFLFSLIFQEYFKDNFEIKFYGIVESDYSYFGGIPTQSYETLVKNINYEKDVIIIGGGEVFFPKWNLLYSYINPYYSFIKKNKYLNKIEDILNLSKKIFFQTKFSFPFTPNLKIENLYISVGGKFSNSLNTEEIKYLINILSKSKFISVRDNRTHFSLNNYGIKSTIIPDSAILMSKIFPLEEIIRRIKNKSLLDINGKYLFLQVGKYLGPKEIKKFVTDVNKIAKDKKLCIVCCPIGIAPGHEDHKLLKQFCKIDPNWILVEPGCIFDVMYLIAKSEFYMGTSLHGLITAFSFNKLAISLNRRVGKANSFIETWCSDFYETSIDYEDLIDKMEIVFHKWNYSKAKLQLEYCQKLVEDYFIEITTYLTNKLDQ